MKKWSLALAFVLSVSLCGCGKSAAKEPAEEAVVETAAPVEEEPAEEIVEEEVVEEETAEEDDSVKNSDLKSTSITELSDDIYSFQISINDVIYQFPVSYQDFIATGWTYSGDEADTIPSGSYGITDSFDIGDDYATSYAVNFGINEVSMADCYLGGVDLDLFSFKTGSAELPKGIQLGVSTQDEVKAAYGEPSSSYESDSYPTMTYEMDSYSNVRLTFDAEKGLILQGIEIRNFTMPENFDAGEIDTSVPEITQTYQAPDSIGDDLLDYTFEYAGDIYVLPVPVSQFINNGWKILDSESETTITGDSYGKVTMMKDNQKFYTFVRNYHSNATSIENCFITQISANINNCNVSMTVANGITMGMKQADLEKALKGYDFEKESSSYDYYEVSDPDSLIYGYEIIVREGVITGIEAEFSPKVSEFRTMMGVE